MSLTESHPDQPVGNPVRREALLRSLRSTSNVVILSLWTILMVTIGIVVLIDQIGLSRPFRPTSGSVPLADGVGAALGQWWIASIVPGSMLLAVVLSATACTAAGGRERLQSWRATLVRPGGLIVGLWLSQMALIVFALVLVLPIAAIAVSLGGSTVRQLGIGLAGATIAGGTASASTIAMACRARRATAPAIAAILCVTALFVAPYAVHVIRDRPVGDPAMAVMPLTAVADAASPLPAPRSRFCGVDGCGWDRSDVGDAPLEILRDKVRPWSGPLVPWAWTGIGALVVAVTSLVVARIRIARPASR